MRSWWHKTPRGEGEVSGELDGTRTYVKGVFHYLFRHGSVFFGELGQVIKGARWQVKNEEI